MDATTLSVVVVRPALGRRILVAAKSSAIFPVRSVKSPFRTFGKGDLTDLTGEGGHYLACARNTFSSMGALPETRSDL